MLRDYQIKADADIETAWQTNQNVLAVLPTGSGKTRLFSHILAKQPEPSVAIAHRQELVGQMSLSLSAAGVVHRLIAAESTVKDILSAQRNAFGRTFYNPSALVACAGVDTLIRRDEPWFSRVRTWVTDEAHHLLRENKWGKAVELFPNARGLGVTATPIRTEGKGLGRHADGVFDYMVVGPTGRDLMKMGYLCDYEVRCPTVDDIDFDNLDLGKDGDFKLNQLRERTHESKKLVGDIVDCYLRYAKGKRGITFTVDLEEARKVTERFNAAGVPAVMVSADTSTLVRSMVLKKFRSGEILQLVNVDLFGEGVDVPGVEVVSMGRRTLSYSLFAQQLGRAMRPIYADGYELNTVQNRLDAILYGAKPKAILIDHVGNYIYHATMRGVPESFNRWSLNAVDKKAKNKRDPDAIPLTACRYAPCGLAYERYRVKCPYCGHVPQREPRSKPDEVQGDLMLLTPEIMMHLRGEIDRVDGPVHFPSGASQVVRRAIELRHRERQLMQHELRESISQWGGIYKHRGLTERESQRLFWDKFGIDIASAQALGAREAQELKILIDGAVKNEHT
jgi:DNA repair protein RadD